MVYTETKMGSIFKLKIKQSLTIIMIWCIKLNVLNNNNNNNNNINNNNNNNNNIPETRKYWVDVQRGIASSHDERDPL